MFGDRRPRIAGRLDRLRPPAGLESYMQDDLVDRLQALIGQRVRNARYWDGTPTYGTPPWEARDARFDACEGLELDLDDGRLLSLQATPGGLVAFSKGVLDLDPAYGTKGLLWDVSTRSRWGPLLERPIEDVAVYEAAGGASEVVLRFAGGLSLYLAAAEVAPGLMVVSDEETAATLRLGAHGPGRPLRHPGAAPALPPRPDQATGLEPELGGG